MFELNNTNSNQSLTNSANTASTNILTSQVMPAVYQDLQRFAADPNLNEKLKLTFGSDYNVQTAQAILASWLIGDFSTLPPIELVEREEIAGSNGAFATATNKIYFSNDILTGEPTNIAAVEDIILEEIGHSIDAQVNPIDAPGDEGAIFAATVQGKALSLEALSALKAEDDSAVVIMGGKQIVIEQNTMSNPQNINNSTGYFTGRKLYSSQSVSTNNDKYYRFTIGKPGGRLSVGLKDLSGSADVSLIRDANKNGRVDSGEILASSVGSSNKLISGNQLDNLSAGTYYVRVKGNARYGIAVNLDQAGNSRSEGNSGGFSINKARNLGTLSDIAPSQDYQLSDFVGSGLGDPVDYYSFRLDKPRSLSFALRNMIGNANVYIEDGKGTVLAKSENGGSADELSSVNLADKTTYYVRVVPVGSESTNYRLVLNPGQVIPQSNPSINSGFKVPLPGGKEWLINQGTHNNNTKPALDFGATFKENGKLTTKSDIPVLASATGKVIRSGYIAPPPGGHEWGNFVWIDHDQPYDGSGYVTIYAHLNTRNVQEGSLVNQGDKIGTMGTSGNVPLHLHFEVMYNDKAIGKTYTPTPVSNKQIQNFRLDGQPLTSYSNVGGRYDTYKPSTNKYMDLSTLPSFPKK